MDKPDRLAEAEELLALEHGASHLGEMADALSWAVTEIKRLRGVVEGLTPYAYQGAAEGSESDIQAVNALFDD